MQFDLNITKVTKEYLLSKNSQETYLEYYLGIPVKKGLFRSPLREDRTPTCAFYRNKSGDVIFKDFSGKFSGNFISVVMEINKCSYGRALNIIANDFGYKTTKGLIRNKKPISISPRKLEETKPSEIRVEVRPFSEEELNWWKQYGITESILKKFKVFSCKTVFLNDTIFSCSTKSNPSYGYYRGKNDNGIELWRIYYPTRNQYRFISNWSASMIQGAKQLPSSGETLVVTKSMKDVMCLYSLGITAIAPNSENLFISDSQFDKLVRRFTNIVLFYDNDLPGIRNMNKIRKNIGKLNYNLKCIWLPRGTAKDISDFHSKYGREKTIEMIRKAEEILQVKLIPNNYGEEPNRSVC